MTVNEVYAEAESQFSNRRRDFMMNARAHTSGGPLGVWFNFVSSSSHWCGRVVGGIGCESVGNADLLSDHFDRKQSRAPVDLLS